MMNNNHKQKKERSKLLRALSFSSQIGVTSASCVLIGVLGGKFLDDRLGTAPWLLLIFSLLGVAAAIKALFDLGKKK